MVIQILQLLEGAKNATGLTVIIDVFRAFSTACYAFSNGVERIYPVSEVEKALKMKEKDPSLILIGEMNEQKPEGFDYGNSPTHILNADFSGRTMVHRTSSGTQGIVFAANAGEIITGSFVNASAIVNYIRSTNPASVSLVCMGYACEYPTDEDTFCAEFIKNELEGKKSDFQAMKQQIRKGTGARFFLPESQGWAPFTDFDLCMDINRFNFILKAVKEGDRICLQKIALQDHKTI